jgi:hypothetical protein
MRNPWLDIPLQDYDGHMSSSSVAQLKALADLFDEALTYCQPESVAVLGIAGGNGLDRIDPRTTRRVVGIDIQPTYLEAVRHRYPRLPLTLHCIDLEYQTVNEQAVELVYAVLIFRARWNWPMSAKRRLTCCTRRPSCSGATTVEPRTRGHFACSISNNAITRRAFSPGGPSGNAGVARIHRLYLAAPDSLRAAWGKGPLARCLWKDIREQMPSLRASCSPNDNSRMVGNPEQS